MSRDRQLGTALFLALVAVGCGHVVHEERGMRSEKPLAVNVELDLFSGRPNPTLDLLPAEGDELLRLLSNVPATTAEPTPPGLGYRGFLVSHKATGARFHVFGGIILRLDGVGERRFQDLHGAERWLLARARGQGWPVPEVEP